MELQAKREREIQTHVSKHLKMTLSRRKEKKKRQKREEEEETIKMNIIILPADSRCCPLTVAKTNTSMKPLTSGPRGAEKG